jgi:hypothetical protein
MINSIQRAQSIVGTNNDGGRPENDFYPTPPEGTAPLLFLETFEGDIWEPACGDGSMSKVIESRGYNVISTDVQPRNYGSQLDFFFAPALLAPNIVTNPPFRLAQEFAERGLILGASKLALLCKLAFLEGQERGNWFPQTPLKNVYVFSKRITFSREGTDKGGNGMIAFAWFVWERGYVGRPQIGWI